MLSRRTEMKAIINANVVLEGGILWDGAVLISDGRIVGIGEGREIEIPKDAEIIDAEGNYVGPGFVDIHVHGGNGFSTHKDVVMAAKHFLKNGTTSIFATTDYHMTREQTVAAFRTVSAAIESGEAKTVKGIYAEGPYTNPDYGSHADTNPWHCPVLAEDYVEMVDAGGKHVKVWTVAPEREDLLPFLSYAKQVNPDVVFAIGHSEATPMQVRSNMGRYRPSVLTHAMNATGKLPVFGGTRGYGIDEYCFCERDMYAELISDSCGIHVHPEMQKLLLHTKGVDKVILITDSTVHHNPAPENLKHVPDLNFDPNGGIAGSRLTMNLACRNIMKHTNCGIAQAFIMASLNPARLLGMDAEIGSIELGKIADLVLVDDRFNVKSVLLGGIPQDLNA
jgi:N-acetylglucosamine-6-phosphate deacetylase